LSYVLQAASANLPLAQCQLHRQTVCCVNFADIGSTGTCMIYSLWCVNNIFTVAVRTVSCSRGFQRSIIMK
jgi:hypothetical protein